MCFLGIDIGGTSVRSLVVNSHGEILGYQCVGRYSRLSLWQTIRDCLRTMLASPAVQEVEAAVVGAAGAGATRHRDIRRSVEKGFRAAGLDATPQLVTDIDIAFWSTATSGDGSILVVGTGAIAGRFLKWQCVDRRDGAGWLLGDCGSGYWIGRKALRAAAADLDGRGPGTVITRGVTEALGLPTGCSVQDLIGETKDFRPADVASFARLVLFAHGDKVASSILASAASELMTTVTSLGTSRVILAGGLFAEDMSRDRHHHNALRRRVEESLSGCTYAIHPVIGACWAAGRSKGVDLNKRDLLHELAIGPGCREDNDDD